MVNRLKVILSKGKFNLDILAIILLIFAAAILFLPVMMKWQGIFHNDQAMSETLRHYFFARNLQKGIIPLWNPHVWCGAIPHYAFVYPVENYYIPLWPFHFLANLNNFDQTYWMVSILPLLLHFILAAIGMFVLLKRVVKCNNISAFIGAFVYIYSPVFVYSYVSENNLIMQSWLPWLIYIYIKTLKKLRLWKLFLGGIIFSFIWIAGKPHYMPFIMIIWGSVIFSSMITNLRLGKKRAFIRAFIAAFIIFILGTALSAIYLYPLYDSSRYTELHVKLDPDAVISYGPGNLPPSYLPTLFVPNLFGNITGSNFIFKRLMFWYANMSGGMAATLVVLLGALIPIMMYSRGRQHNYQLRYTIIGIFLYLFSILCALGGNTPFYRLFIGWIPIVGGLPFPIRYRMIQCFAASLLIAIGINSLIAYEFSIPRHRLHKLVWLYVIFSFSVICIVLFFPQSSDRSGLWLGKSDAKIKGFFLLREPVGTYTPKTARVKKIKVMFDGESEGEIRYSDNHRVLPNEGTLAKRYRVRVEGWVEFDVDVPPNKFLYIYPKSGYGSIGYWKERRPCFSYNDNWAIRTDINAISLYQYQGVVQEKISLFHRLKNGYIVKTPVVSSCIYWLLVSFAIIISVYLLSPKKFIYFLGAVVLIEFFVFGMMAFYGGTFNEDITNTRTFLPHNVRALRPSDHPMLQRMVIQVPAVATDSTLRIATSYPFYDNFVYLNDVNNRFALMGEPAYPLEKRFKRAIETVYGEAMDPGIFYDGGGSFPRSPEFLNNFSVGYFMSNNPEDVFTKGERVPLPCDSNFFVYINREALPRAYTINRIVAIPEEEQFRELISGDLRKAVYVNPEEGINLEAVAAEDYIYHFGTLQQMNPIKQIDFNNPNQINIDIDVTVPSMLVLTEVWYPGWESVVDGRQEKIYRVNYCQRGIWLNKGTHHVQLKFIPLAWRIGGGISLGTMGLMMGLLTVSKIKRRKEKI